MGGAKHLEARTHTLGSHRSKSVFLSRDVTLHMIACPEEGAFGGLDDGFNVR